MIKDLIRLANLLDDHGNEKAARYIDHLIYCCSSTHNIDIEESDIYSHDPFNDVEDLNVYDVMISEIQRRF